MTQHYCWLSNRGQLSTGSPLSSFKLIWFQWSLVLFKCSSCSVLLILWANSVLKISICVVQSLIGCITTIYFDMISELRVFFFSCVMVLVDCLVSYNRLLALIRSYFNSSQAMKNNIFTCKLHLLFIFNQSPSGPYFVKTKIVINLFHKIWRWKRHNCQC